MAKFLHERIVDAGLPQASAVYLCKNKARFCHLIHFFVLLQHLQGPAPSLPQLRSERVAGPRPRSPLQCASPWFRIFLLSPIRVETWVHTRDTCYAKKYCEHRPRTHKTLKCVKSGDGSYSSPSLATNTVLFAVSCNMLTYCVIQVSCCMQSLGRQRAVLRKRSLLPCCLYYDISTPIISRSLCIMHTTGIFSIVKRQKSS